VGVALGVGLRVAVAVAGSGVAVAVNTRVAVAVGVATSVGVSVATRVGVVVVSTPAGLSAPPGYPVGLAVAGAVRLRASARVAPNSKSRLHSPREMFIESSFPYSTIPWASGITVRLPPVL
jgi:hypothetical protein